MITGDDGIDCVALGNTFVSGVASDASSSVVMGTLHSGLLVELDPFANFSRLHCMQEKTMVKSFAALQPAR